VCNLGASDARGTLLCFLNDDIEVITEEWIERLSARTALDGVGAAAPMLYYPSDRIQHAGVLLGPGGAALHPFKQRRRGERGAFGRGELEQDYSCVTAACLLVRRSVFEQVGGFDESLPVAFNDVDLCIRIRRVGARIVWTPSVEMYHHESLTLGRHDSPARRSQFLRDVRRLRARWGAVLDADPCYNPNLSLELGSSYFLAWPPRVPSPQDYLSGQRDAPGSRTSALNFSS
jgi:O-antigen biosynthesis protein